MLQMVEIFIYINEVQHASIELVKPLAACLGWEQKAKVEKGKQINKKQQQAAGPDTEAKAVEEDTKLIACNGGRGQEPFSHLSVSHCAVSWTDLEELCVGN